MRRVTPVCYAEYKGIVRSPTPAGDHIRDPSLRFSFLEPGGLEAAVVILIGEVLIVNEPEAIGKPERPADGRDEWRPDSGTHVHDVIWFQINIRIDAGKDTIEVDAGVDFAVGADSADDFGSRGNSDLIEHTGGNDGLFEGDLAA